MTADDLAAASGAHPDALLRLLRALTTIDVVHEEDDGRFAITSLGSLLKKDHPRSMRDLVLLQVSPHLWDSWRDLYDAIVTGAPVFERIHGMSHFDYLAAHTEAGEVFNRAMTSISKSDVEPHLPPFDLADARRIVDVGGGEGLLLRSILERNPQAHGVLFDLPHVVASATEIRGSAVADRCELVGGNMFADVPAGGDTYLMKTILHDWDDGTCLRLLRNVRAAISPTGRLLVIERLVQPSNIPDRAKWLDLNMLVLLGGRERTEEEFRELFTAAGFTLTRVLPVGRTFVLEGVPA